MRWGVVLASCAWLCTLAALLPDHPLRAGQATLSNGKTIEVQVKLSPDGRLRLESAKGSMHLRDVVRVRFPAPTLAPVRPALLHRLTLSGDQSLEGELLSLNGKQLRFGTAWAGTLTIPRQAVVDLSHPAGWVTRFADDFEGDSKGWKVTASARRSDEQHTSGKSSLRLNAAGQSGDYVLSQSMDAGRVGANFHIPPETAGARWLLEAQFQGNKGPAPLRVVLAGGPDGHRVDLPFTGPEGTSVPFKAGWHHLGVEFGAVHLIVSIDDLVLWPIPERKDRQAVAQQGPGGPLQRVRLLCEARGKAPAVRGAVYVDDFSLAQRVTPAGQQVSDQTQDQVCLLAGDQLFGEIVGAAPRSLELKGRYGARKFSWGEVRGVRLRHDPPPPSTTEGEHVRLLVQGHPGSAPDAIEGVVRAIDERRLQLLHPLLGELSIDRQRLQELRWAFYGKRVEVDNALHHLGRKLVPTLPAPRPDGLELRRTFRLDALPNDARLLVSVVQLRGPGDHPDIARALERGGLRTEVVLNRRVVDYLNRHGERSSPQPRWLSVPLPRNALRIGDNELLVRQTQDPETGQYEDCCVMGLAIEMPR